MQSNKKRYYYFFYEVANKSIDSGYLPDINNALLWSDLIIKLVYKIEFNGMYIKSPIIN